MMVCSTSAASHREQQDAHCPDRQSDGRKGQRIFPVVPRHGAGVDLGTVYPY